MYSALLNHRGNTHNNTQYRDNNTCDYDLAKKDPIKERSSEEHNEVAFTSTATINDDTTYATAATSSTNNINTTVNQYSDSTLDDTDVATTDVAFMLQIADHLDMDIPCGSNDNFCCTHIEVNLLVSADMFITPNMLLLENHSTAHIIKNAFFLSKIHAVAPGEEMKCVSNEGRQESNLQGTFDAFHTKDSITRKQLQAFSTCPSSGDKFFALITIGTMILSHSF